MECNTIKILIQDKDIGERLDKTLSKKLKNMSRNRIQSLIRDGCVLYNSKKIIDQSQKISQIGYFLVSFPPNKKLKILSQKIDLKVKYEDSSLIVIDKPAGMVVHPAYGNYKDTLVNALLYHCKLSLSGIGGVERPGIVHRLDKMTSGLIVVAKNDLIHEGLSYQFKKRKIIREYEALVYNRLEESEGEINTNICRSRVNRKKMTTTSKNKGKPASTYFKKKEEYQIYKNQFVNQVLLKLKTGRTHQIRVHMKYFGNPLIGDLVYGKKIIKPQIKENNELISFIKNLDELQRHALHAKTLGFEHPKNKKQLIFTSELPYDMTKLIKLLKDNKDINK